MTPIEPYLRAKLASTEIFTSSLTSTPPASSVWFQVRPKSDRRILPFAE